MRLLFSILLLACSMPAPATQPAAPAPTAKLELTAPEKVQAGTGFVEVTAKGSADIQFDVFGVFEDASLKVQTKQFGNTLIVGIPGSPGAIRITAAGVIAGKPVLTSAVITVEAKEDAGKPDAPAKPPDKPRLHVTVIGLPESAALRKGLEEAGLRYWPYPTVPANRPDLAAQAAKIGQPCVLVQTPDGKIVLAKKIASEQDVADAVNSLGK